MANRQKELMDVASVELGTEVIYTTDEFFASCERMLQPTTPEFKDEYDDHGHWMDGWETRRRRDDRNDYCILRLGQVSRILEIEIDTSYFKGNFPPSVSVAGCYAPDATDEEIINNPENFEWKWLVAQSDLQGHNVESFESKYEQSVTHLKIDIYPDGGIARFRAYGFISFDHQLFCEENINVISRRTGARAIYANNDFFGDFKNILKITEAKNMGDGWESRRRREPGYDWGIIELANPAIIDNLMIDTKFFKGNYPDYFSLNAAYIPNTTHSSVITQSIFWEELMEKQKLQMDQKHYFDSSYFLHKKPITHIRINIYPDGGVSRLQMFGKFVTHKEAEKLL
ncbi:MAG TPA: allantoicase [Arcobacter sp.]|jgi:allantoicase|nr:allantoicase [Arcobacter sp.]